MNSLIKKNILFLAISAIAFTACKKTETANDNLDSAIEQSGAIAISTTSSVVGLNSTLTDSIYAIGAHPRFSNKTSVTAANLPSAITTYLSTNYTGYTFIKAFSITLKTSTTVDSYVVGINFNGKPVAIRFTADGTFSKILELREGGDMKRGRDHHVGGCFDQRDGKQRDSIAVSALAVGIKSYMTTTYPLDTLKAAWINKDGSIIVLSKNLKFFSNVFKIDGTFIKRTEMPTKPGKDAQIAQSALPANVLTYLNTTYPNYVFKKAFSAKENGVIKGYLVIIDASLTKYAVLFDATGVFVNAKIIR